MKTLFATLLIAALPAAALAQAAAPAKPAPATKPAAAKPAPKAKAAANKVEAQKATELATPLEEADPSIKLSEADLEIAKRVHTGEIPCELGNKVKVTPMRREGFFMVSTGIHRYRMHPVESRTGAIRLEDPQRGALWLQLGNKSMLMNQKEGKRLADECQAADQLKVAEEMKTRPPVNLLEPAKN
jgi:hypothetical protein